MQNPEHFFLLVLLLSRYNDFYITRLNGQNNATLAPVKVDVGVILDAETLMGKIKQTCMAMAFEDFYATRNVTPRIVPHFRDSKGDNVDAVSAAIDLLKNVQVQAILGPQKSTQADFIIDIGNRAKVPVISQVTSPSLSARDSPYFVRAAQSSSSQAKAIAAIVKAFGWREVVFIYEDSTYGSGIVPYLVDAMLEISTSAAYRSVISLLAEDSDILEELYKLKTMSIRVFVVHMLPPSASRLFLKANEAGMMSKGYAWIITDALTSFVDSLDSSVIDLMQGVIGVKPYIPRSNELKNFTRRWRKRFHQENPEMDRIEINAHCLWAYDSVTALATAVERVVSDGSSVPQFKTRRNVTDLEAIGTSEMGPLLIKSLRNIRLRGSSGDFHIIDGELQPSTFEIVNVIGKGERGIGFWTEKYGISSTSKPSDGTEYAANRDDFGIIIWPGESSVVPKGWEIPTGGKKKLRIGVPVKGGLGEFVNVERDSQTSAVVATGFCIDVFEEAIMSLPYALPYEFIPFETPDGHGAGNYDDLVYQIFVEKYDAVVGDVTILANRTTFVDFTLPFTESGVSTVVPVKGDDRKNAWIFMKPLTMELWLTTGAFFVFTGFVIWVLEHRVNKQFRGPRRKQVGMIFWFSFSTLVFAHREKVVSNLTRFVLIVWVFVVLVLTSSYTASLTSMLTVEQLQPTITDISDLIRKGEYVGYQEGSFIPGLLRRMEFDESKFRSYNTIEEYDDALSRGSRNGGVSAIVDELPYLRLFLSKYCKKYTLIGPTYKTAGFGFAFPKGSPLTADVSKAVLNVTEGERMLRISQKWLENGSDCAEQNGSAITSDSLTLDSFKGLFLIAGIASSTALVIFISIFIHENRNVLNSEDNIWHKLSAMVKIFDEEKDSSSEACKKPTDKNEEENISRASSPDAMPDLPRSPTIRFSPPPEGFFSQDEWFSTTEPGSPVLDAIFIRETTDNR